MSTKRFLATWAVVALSSLSLSTGCATGREPGEVEGRDVGKVQRINFGEVVEVTQVDVENMAGHEGALIGAGLGAVAGILIGPGTTGSIIGGILGAVAGGLAGKEIQEQLQDDGYEYEIKLDDGSKVAVVELHESPIAVGTRVKLVHGTEYVRVEPA